MCYFKSLLGFVALILLVLSIAAISEPSLINTICAISGIISSIALYITARIL